MSAGPFNALATSSEILQEQRNLLEGRTITSTDLDINAFRALPASIGGNEAKLYELQQTVGTEPSKNQPSVQSKETAPQKYYDGPTPTGQTLTSVAKKYDLPTSLSESLSDAQDAILGVTADMTKTGDERKSFFDIITQGNRLRGLGLIILCVAMLLSSITVLARSG